MSTGTGLDAQFGFAPETAVGTAVTVNKFLEMVSESIEFAPKWVKPKGIRAGSRFPRASRLTQVSHGVAGAVALEFANRNMGRLTQMALGSSVTTPTNITGVAYKQVHQPGSLLGQSLTVQIGRPQANGTVIPHTFNGCKITDWELALTSDGVITFTPTFDGWNETTSTTLATASYTSGVYNFSGINAQPLKIGGTASTSSGVVSVASGTAAAATVKSFTLKCTNPLNTERIGLGSGGTKSEQLENDERAYTFSVEVEYLRSEWYDPFKNKTSQPYQLTLVGAQIGSTGQFDTLDIIIPAGVMEKNQTQVAGPDVVMAKIEGTVYDDEVNAPVQLTIISADSTL